MQLSGCAADSRLCGQVAQCVLDGSWRWQTVIEVTDSGGKLPPGSISVLHAMLGLVVRAVQGQDWGRTNCFGPALGLKMFAVDCVLRPWKSDNHAHCRMLIKKEGC